MGKIKVTECPIKGLKVIEPTVFGDDRGYFMETYNFNDYKEAGIDMEFVQDNQSCSKKGVLRGLHFQINYPQDKLVRVISGEVFDVAVDLREGSETFGQWYGVVLSAENKKQFLFQKISHTDSSFFPMLPNLRINALISTIRTTRADWHGMTLISAWNGRYRKEWS